ncbi:MAG: hypothetical protein WCW63_00540 [Acholeplasmataceae bacterium]|jgi:hypothetical protein
MSNQYVLNPGKYFLGDPSIVIQKKGIATKFINQMWDKVYEDSIRFKKVMIDNVNIYLMKSMAGDGMFEGIGTDSGVICIICFNDMQNELLFHIPKVEKGFKWLILDTQVSVFEENGVLKFQNGLEINTNL